MLHGKVSWLLVGVVATFAALANAQTRVKLQSNAGKSTLQAAIAELTVPTRMGAAQQRLWQAGESAVPLLAAVVERGGAGEAAARFVLEQLGCEAAAAVPVLRRIVDDAQAEPARRARVAATLAKIDGPPMILLSEYTTGAVVELDLDGKERRRVAIDSAWGAWPMPGDQIGVMSFSNGAVVRADWQGKQEILRQLESSSGSVVPLADDFVADVVFTTWQEKGQLIRRTADGQDVWKKTIDALRVERDFGDELLVVTRDKPRIVWLSLDGEELRSWPLPEICYSARRLPGGGILVASMSTKVYEFAPDGTQVGEFSVDEAPQGIVRLRDGRTIVTSRKKLAMFGADGKELWSRPTAWGGPLFVRQPTREGK